MVWFKVDDGLHKHRKVRKVLAEEPAALSLWTVAGSWSSDEGTDGFIPDDQLPWLIPADGEKLAQALVAARLWKRVRGGYQFHQFLEDGDGTKRNPSRAEVEEARRKRADAGRKGGLNSAKKRVKKEASAQANASALAKPVARPLLQPPTRPDPPPSIEGGSGVVTNSSSKPPDLTEVREKLRDASRKANAPRQTGALDALLHLVPNPPSEVETP